MQYITSTTNEKVKELIRLLSSKKHRRDKGLFVAEGVRLCEDFAKNGYEAVELYYTEKAYNLNKETVDMLINSAASVYVVNDIISDKVSETKSPQGVFAVFALPQTEHEIKSNENYMLLASLSDPGNLGTIIRSVAAFDLDALILTDDCPDPYSGKVLRSAMGGVGRMNIIIAKDFISAITMLKKEGISVFGAVLAPDAKDLIKMKMSGGICAVIGNEGRGLTSEEISYLDSKIIIPMAENSESLNASVAASIIAYEMFRQKTAEV